MGQLVNNLIELSSSKPNELEQSDVTMIEALTHLEHIAHELCRLRGTKKGSDDFDKYIAPLLDSELKSKSNTKSWRIVIDMATENDTYCKAPNIQICSGPPSYHRFIMSFEEDGVKTKLETACVVEEPDLASIRSQGSPSASSQSLASLKEFYDQAQIQRIAILGSARVFAHPELIDPKNPNLGQKAPETKHLWGQNYNKRVEIELNKFLDVMEETGHNFLTVNGGWAGYKEQSTGMPLISSLIGAISDKLQDSALPPITVMPEVGTFDRVTTRADAYKNGSPGKQNQGDIHTFFEVPGGWGDDSKYLVGLSTGLLVFEPYGFWTNIEIANGVAQNKPVAVIADPDNLKPGKPYYEAMKNGETYMEIKIPLPNNKEGVYRVYQDAGEATRWINEQSMKNMQEMAREQTLPEPIMPDFLQNLAPSSVGNSPQSFFAVNNKASHLTSIERLKTIAELVDELPEKTRQQALEYFKTLPEDKLEVIKQVSETAQKAWDEQYTLGHTEPFKPS